MRNILGNPVYYQETVCYLLSKLAELLLIIKKERTTPNWR